ncbi:hypothetical protein LUZ61_007965 [Rhynchospora tenuis]|uniref:Uncharacterized protein n=1 Tax=Rhynchospora tenuis TaxID=198213 RepID=A0AAD6EX62_9POAL|nr:hypothetical protein LUZ61_007965 [Rhynchospora tenuis]
MEQGNNSNNNIHSQEPDVRKGPWTMEEDIILFNYVSTHGDGNWNNVARAAGLNRTGKSCRLRWLNYLRPDVRRGNITQEEQMLIMDLHSRWGNRWSKIAKHLPGRTDNEIKNFWRTRMQKKVKQGESSDNNCHLDTLALTDEASTCSTSHTANSEQNYHNLSHQNVNHHQLASSLDGALPSQFSAESNYNFWNFEEFWPDQHFNGD